MDIDWQTLPLQQAVAISSLTYCSSGGAGWLLLPCRSMTNLKALAAFFVGTKAAWWALPAFASPCYS